MSNPYSGMASGFAAGETLGWTAFTSSLVACSVWPELLRPVPAANSGLLLNGAEKIGKFLSGKSSAIAAKAGGAFSGVTNVPVRLKLIITDTGQMLEACGKIHESGEAALRYVEVLDRQLQSIQADVWQGDEQRAYQERLQKFRNAIQTNVNLAGMTAGMTALIGSLRFIQLTIAAWLSLTLAIMAAAYWIAMAIPFGQGVAASIRASGTPLANMLPTIIRTMDEIMVTIGQAYIALMGVLTATAGISDSIRLDNAEGMKDLAEAGKETVGDLLKKLSKGHVSVLGA